MTTERTRGAVYGLLGAGLFGIAAPIGKLLLGSLNPVLLGGLFYLGAAGGLWLWFALSKPTREAALTRADVPTLVAIVVVGGVIAPVMMLLGLQRASALSGSLLLNLEAPMTLLLAVLLFREHLGRYAAAAAVCIFGGAAVLQLQPGSYGADSTAVLLIAGACLAWALDNNLTQRLSLRDPFAIVRIKTLVAGLTNTVIGVALARATLPSGRIVAIAFVVGAFGYGVSIVLDAYALRLAGAVREAAYFATAPFWGATISVIFLGDLLRWQELLALVAMVLGVVVLLREKHRHEHVHEAIAHNHLHRHDEHHQHDHTHDEAMPEPHSHEHVHTPVTHEHQHAPDVHHRHRH